MINEYLQTNDNIDILSCLEERNYLNSYLQKYLQWLNLNYLLNNRFEYIDHGYSDCKYSFILTVCSFFYPANSLSKNCYNTDNKYYHWQTPAKYQSLEYTFVLFLILIFFYIIIRIYSIFSISFVELSTWFAIYFLVFTVTQQFIFFGNQIFFDICSHEL